MEADFIGVEFVKIVEDAADGKALVIVQRMLEDADGKRAAVEHQMLADFAAAVGEAVGKLFVGGEEKQARGFRAIGAHDDGFGFLALDVALRVEINSARSAAIGVEFDAVNVGVRTNFAAAGFFCHANSGGERAGFSSYFAGER